MTVGVYGCFLLIQMENHFTMCWFICLVAVCTGTVAIVIASFMRKDQLSWVLHVPSLQGLFIVFRGTGTSCELVSNGQPDANGSSIPRLT